MFIAAEQLSVYREEVRAVLENQMSVSDEDRAHINALRKALHVTVETHIEILASFKWSLLDFLDGEKSSTEA